MCLKSVTEVFRGTNRSTYGYKIVIKSGQRYRPLYCNTSERWSIGKWSTSSSRETPLRNRRNSDMSRLRFWLTPTKLSVKAIMSSSGEYYEPGYHYFDTLADAFGVAYGSHLGRQRMRILYCEFKQVVAVGKQYNIKCKVAKKMMPMDELTLKEAQKTLEAEYDDK